MNDEQLMRHAKQLFDEHELKTKTPPPIDPVFRQWVNECVECMDNGESIVDYKKRTVLQPTVPFEQIVKNTEKQNAKIKD